MAYRNGVEELERRRLELSDEASRVAEKRGELEALTARETEIRSELLSIDASLKGLRPDKHAIDLASVRIASPCPADWDAMVGKEGKLCARFFVREDGTVRTSDCPVGLRRKRVRLAIYGAAGGA